MPSGVLGGKNSRLPAWAGAALAAFMFGEQKFLVAVTAADGAVRSQRRAVEAIAVAARPRGRRWDDASAAGGHRLDQPASAARQPTDARASHQRRTWLASRTIPPAELRRPATANWRPTSGSPPGRQQRSASTSVSDEEQVAVTSSEADVVSSAVQWPQPARGRRSPAISLRSIQAARVDAFQRRHAGVLEPAAGAAGRAHVHAGDVAAPCCRRSVKPPVDWPTSRQCQPRTSIPQARSAPSRLEAAARDVARLRRRRAARSRRRAAGRRSWPAAASAGPRPGAPARPAAISRWAWLRRAGPRSTSIWSARMNRALKA